MCWERSPPIPLKDSDLTDHDLGRFVPSAEGAGIRQGCIVLEVDPIRHHHRRGHDEFEHFPIRTPSVVVGVQRTPPAEIDSGCPLTRRKNECGAPGQSPLGPRFTPILASRKKSLSEECPQKTTLLKQDIAEGVSRWVDPTPKGRQNHVGARFPLIGLQSRGEAGAGAEGGSAAHPCAAASRVRTASGSTCFTVSSTVANTVAPAAW